MEGKSTENSLLTFTPETSKQIAKCLFCFCSAWFVVPMGDDYDKTLTVLWIKNCLFILGLAGMELLVHNISAWGKDEKNKANHAVMKEIFFQTF